MVDERATPSARNFGLILHLSGLLSPLAVMVGGGPFGTIFGLIPLTLWLVRRHDSAFIDDHGREAVNFQITLAIYTLASLVLMIVCVGFLLYFATGIFGIVAMILAGSAAHDGQYFRYPACIRLVKCSSAAPR